MKSVTKLGRTGGPIPVLTNGDTGSAPPDGNKRKYREMLEVHAEQLANLQETQQFVLKELHSLSKLAAKVFASDGANSIGSPQKD